MLSPEYWVRFGVRIKSCDPIYLFIVNKFLNLLHSISDKNYHCNFLRSIKNSYETFKNEPNIPPFSRQLTSDINHTKFEHYILQLNVSDVEEITKDPHGCQNFNSTKRKCISSFQLSIASPI